MLTYLHSLKPHSLSVGLHSLWNLILQLSDYVYPIWAWYKANLYSCSSNIRNQTNWQRALSLLYAEGNKDCLLSHFTPELACGCTLSLLHNAWEYHPAGSDSTPSGSHTGLHTPSSTALRVNSHLFSVSWCNAFPVIPFWLVKWIYMNLLHTLSRDQAVHQPRSCPKHLPSSSGSFDSRWMLMWHNKLLNTAAKINRNHPTEILSKNDSWYKHMNHIIFPENQKIYVYFYIGKSKKCTVKRGFDENNCYGCQKQNNKTKQTCKARSFYFCKVIKRKHLVL